MPSKSVKKINLGFVFMAGNAIEPILAVVGCASMGWIYRGVSSLV